MPEELSWTALPTVSVIIPTYKRKDSLLRTLDSLSRQTYPAERFEVIVVDDGGSDGTGSVAESRYLFDLRYLRQANQGATVARNHGADQSHGDILVFVDDDIAVGTTTLQILIGELLLREQTVVLGTLHMPQALLRSSAFSRVQSRNTLEQDCEGYVPFQECMTGLLAITKSEFYQLGMFQDPTGGWPNWDDVDFGFRASQAGFRFWRSAAAVAEHWDYAATDLDAACQRWYRASKSAPRLFRRHPELKAHIRMFREKEPIAWRQDAPALILNKLARQVIWSRPAMWAMQHAVPLLEQRAPESRLLALFYRWIISGYIYRGYRDGLREIAQRANR